LSSLGKNYGFTIKSQNTLYFNLLHRASPTLKLLALIFALVSIFKGWIYFFVAVGAFLISILANIVKWQFNFSYDYILYGTSLKIVRTTNVLRFKELFKLDLTKVISCEPIAPEQIPKKDIRLGVKDNMQLEYILLLKLKGEPDTVITADKYLYSKIVEIMEKAKEEES